MNHILFKESMYLSFYIQTNQIDNESHFIYRKYVSFILYFKTIKSIINHILFKGSMYL